MSFYEKQETTYFIYNIKNILLTVVSLLSMLFLMQLQLLLPLLLLSDLFHILVSLICTGLLPCCCYFCYHCLLIAFLLPAEC